MAFAEVRFRKLEPDTSTNLCDSAEDQAKVRLAIKNKTVHAAVAQLTATTSNSSSQAAEKKKRKASFIEPSFVSTPATSGVVAPTPAPRVPSAIYPPTASQMIEVAEEADFNEPEEDEPPEELYTTLNTNIVGVQYYNGYMRQNICCAPHIDASARSYRVWRTCEA